MRVVDSVGWIEYFVDGPLAERYARYIENPDELATPSIVICEVFKKVLRDSGERPAVEAIANMQKTTVVPLTSELAVNAAEIGIAHKLPMADAIVYATAQSVNATVVTSDQHFKGLPEVEFVG
ncbi:MAG: type II toxin-antitoxin system VapC family toxin [Armatimonadota bacterium]|nr:type II toxin-antitoxin system VapC family toxin [Armatimonadota bacterium]